MTPLTESEAAMRAYWEQVTLDVVRGLIEQRKEFLYGPMEAAKIAVEVADLLCREWAERNWVDWQWEEVPQK